ncbi:Splicing factor-like protein [Sesbania bispinosa]|nr:Splicing factor-like protein [Sesbania bispinosa]
MLNRVPKSLHITQGLQGITRLRNRNPLQGFSSFVSLVLDPQAGSIEVAGRQVYSEERRPYSNINIPSRGGKSSRFWEQ